MKSALIIALGLGFAGVATPAFAQSPPATGQHTRHARLDTNGDGVIDRSEAAKAPKFAEHFDKFDTDKDGRITADERPQRGMHGGRHERGGAMAKLDANADGVIDRSEAAKAPKFAEHFDKLDANKDGRITSDERPQRGGRREGGKGARGERMAQLDTNGDGRFSRDELAGRERALQNFTAIDVDKDGFVTREEMKAHHQAHRGERKPQP
jgi:EF hand